MVRLQVAEGGDGLQMWRVAANIMNKLSRTADKGWAPSLAVGRGTNNVENTLHRDSDLYGLFVPWS